MPGGQPAGQYLAQTAPQARTLPWAAASVVSSWPEGPQSRAHEMATLYGPPQAVGQDRIVWGPIDCWRSIVVFRDESVHYWPTPHTDYLAQTINYKADPSDYSRIAEFDGSVIVDRTRGTLTAICDSEPMNFLALNLAHSVAIDALSVSEARLMYEEIAQAYVRGEPHPWTQSLQFEPPTEYTGDPDRPSF